MEWPSIVLIYLAPTLVLTCSGMQQLLSEFSSKGDRKVGAAMLLAAPVWPLALVGITLHGIFTLYRLAWKVLCGKVEDF